MIAGRISRPAARESQNCLGLPRATPALAKWGTDELKREFLAPAIAGEVVTSIAVSEASGGSDVAAPGAWIVGPYQVNSGQTFLFSAINEGNAQVDLFIQVADKTGPKLTVDSFIDTLQGFSSPRDMFGADAMSFSRTKHLGSNRARLSQIINGKWTPITDYITE